MKSIINVNMASMIMNKQPQSRKRLENEFSISEKLKIWAFNEQYKRNLVGYWQSLEWDVGLNEGPQHFGYMFFPDGMGETVIYSEYGPLVDKGRKFVWKEHKEFTISLKFEKSKEWIKIRYEFGFLRPNVTSTVHGPLLPDFKDIVLSMFDEKGKLLDECVPYEF